MKSILIFPMLIALTFSSSIMYYMKNGVEEKKYLYSGNRYYFELDTDYDDTFKVKIKLGLSYYSYDVDLLYYEHPFSGSYESYYSTSTISPSVTIDSYLILEKKIDLISTNYITVIVVPRKDLGAVYITLSSENDTIRLLIIFLIVIPITIFIIVAVLIFIRRRCWCRYSRVVVTSDIEPIQPPVTTVQPMIVQPPVYQPPIAQVQYMPPAY